MNALIKFLEYVCLAFFESRCQSSLLTLIRRRLKSDVDHNLERPCLHKRLVVIQQFLQAGAGGVGQFDLGFSSFSSALGFVAKQSVG